MHGTAELTNYNPRNKASTSTRTYWTLNATTKEFITKTWRGTIYGDWLVKVI